MHASDLENNPILRWMRGHMKIANEYQGERRGCTLRYATPMFVVLEFAAEEMFRGLT